MLGLLAPWFLAGLVALGVPVVVHLAHKERKDVIQFPSLMFLSHIPQQSVRRQQLRHWLLFLLRCLAVILLVLAFTRPFFESRSASGRVFSRGGRDIVIALDRSYSMGYGDQWRRATSAAHDVVQRMHGADRAAVVYFGETASAATEFTHDKSALLAAIDSAHPTARVTRYEALFRMVSRMFGDTAQSRREMVLISDDQRTGWGGRALPPLATGTTLTLVNLGEHVTTNVIVSDVTMHYDTVAGHEHVTVSARLANRSATALQKRPVTFELNGRPLQTMMVDCPPHGVVTAAFDAVFTPPGVSRGVIMAGTDSLALDNRFYFMVTRAPALPVLLVEAADANTSAGAFLSRALSINDRLSFSVKSVRVNALSANDLRRTSLVILNDVPFPGGGLGRQLITYVRDGGGLFIVLGKHSRPSDWPPIANEIIARPSATVITRDVVDGATLGFIDHGHAVFDVFTVPHSGDFSAARFSRYWTLVPGPADRQLARFDDGHIALLERRVSAGRVLIWSSDLDGAWNDFPLQPIFLPFLHQAAKYATGYAEEGRWMTVGDILNLPTVFGENGNDTESIVAGRTQYVAIAPGGAQVRLSRANMLASLELTEPGFYDIERTGGAGDSARTVAVNVDHVESDLTPLDTTLFATAVLPPTAAPTAANVGEVVTAIDVEHRQSVWWYLLVGALLLLGLETLLSNRLSNKRSRPVHA